MKTTALALAAILIGTLSQTAEARGEKRCGKRHRGICIKIGEKMIEERVITGYKYERVQCGFKTITRYREEYQPRLITKWRTETRYRNVPVTRWVTEYRNVNVNYYVWINQPVTKYRLVKKKVTSWKNVWVRDRCNGWVLRKQRCQRIITVRVPYQCSERVRVLRTRYERRAYQVEKTCFVKKPYSVKVKYTETCKVLVKVPYNVRVPAYKTIKRPIYGFKCKRVAIFACSQW